MNINELQTDIEDHKEKFGDLYKDITEIMLPFYLLNQKLFEGICNLQESKYRLSNSEADVLITTFVSGDKKYIISPTKLHHKLLFTTGAITKVLKKLEEKELVIRIDDEYDKRSKLVQLTSNGITLAKEMFSDIMNYQENVYGSLTKKEKETFKKLINKVLKEM